MDELTGSQVPMPLGVFPFTVCVEGETLMRIISSADYGAKLLYDDYETVSYPLWQALNFDPPCLDCEDNPNYLDLNVGQAYYFDLFLFARLGTMIGSNGILFSIQPIYRAYLPVGIKAGQQVSVVNVPGQASGQWFTEANPTGPTFCWRGWLQELPLTVNNCPGEQTVVSGILDDVLDVADKKIDGLSFLAPIWVTGYYAVGGGGIQFIESTVEPATMWETSGGNGDGVLLAASNTPRIGLTLNMGQGAFQQALDDTNFGGLMHYRVEIKRIF